MKSKIKQIHSALDNENISWSEIAELDSISAQLGIKNTDDMTATDVLIEIEDKLGVNNGV